MECDSVYEDLLGLFPFQKKAPVHVDQFGNIFTGAVDIIVS
jgi:hypothetical protein